MAKTAVPKAAFRKRRKQKAPKNIVPTKALTSCVEQVLRKNQEVKFRPQQLFSNYTIYGGGLSTKGMFGTREYGAICDNVLGINYIAKGDNQDERIGNELVVKSLKIKGFISALPFHNTTNNNNTPFDVYMVVFKQKTMSTSGSQPALLSPLNMLQHTTNSTLRILGDADSVMLPWNRENYIIKKVKKWRFKPQPYGQSYVGVTTGNTSATASTGLQNLANPNTTSTGSFFRTFSLDIPIKKVLKYQDTQNWPSNEYVSIGFFYVNGDGLQTQSSEARAKVSMISNLKFTEI